MITRNYKAFIQMCGRGKRQNYNKNDMNKFKKGDKAKVISHTKTKHTSGFHYRMSDVGKTITIQSILGQREVKDSESFYWHVDDLEPITNETMKIKRKVNDSIKKGDKVRLTDGSGLKAIGSDKEFYIVHSYPELTGQDKPLKELTATVVATGLSGVYSKKNSCFDFVYELDIIVEIGDAQFFTCSQFVKKKETTFFEWQVKDEGDSIRFHCAGHERSGSVYSKRVLEDLLRDLNSLSDKTVDEVIQELSKFVDDEWDDLPF